VRISQTADRTKTEPIPACREQQVRQRPKDRLVIIRQSFVEICGGNYVAAALLNECMFIADQRLSAGEPEWFQRKASYWVTALQGLASERAIRDAFKTIKSLRLLDFGQANGDQAGAFFRLDVDRLQAAIDGLEADRPQDDPGKIDAPPPAELPITPANSTGHPGKKDGGPHLSYTRAPEPPLDPVFKPLQQQADLGVTDSAGERATPAAADQGFSFTKAQESLKARGFDVRPGQKWELYAKASGFSDAELAETIAVPEFDMGRVENPVVMVLRAADMLRRAKALEVPERDERELAYEADCRRIEAMRRRDGLPSPDEEAERMWRVNVRSTRTLGETLYRLRRGKRCSDPTCGAEFHVEVAKNGESSPVCPACQGGELPEEYRNAYQKYTELRSRGIGWDALRAAYKASVRKLAIDSNVQMAWESTAQWHERLRRLGWPVPSRTAQAGVGA
jgi:hypothetical protein